jgi:hypothetical protein
MKIHVTHGGRDDIDDDLNDDDNGTTTTLEELLEGWNGFEKRIKSSMIELLKYKHAKLSVTVESMKNGQSRRYSHVLSDWHTVLDDVSVKSGLSKASSKSGFFDAGSYFDILKSNYPDFFTDRIALQRLDLLLQDMTAVVSTTKTLNAWANDNTKRLLVALQAMFNGLQGRFDVTNSIARILLAFSYNPLVFREAYINIILTGPAGSGKSTVAKHVADVFAASGLVFKHTMTDVKVHQFLGQYVGQSAPLTTSTLMSALESVVFLDEAYNLATPEAKGSFSSYSQESVGALIDFLYGHRGQLVFIMAGYSDKMNDSVLVINEGVSRRFPFRFDLQPYDTTTMVSIFDRSFQTLSGTSLEKDTLEALASVVDTGVFYASAGDMTNLATTVATQVASTGSDGTDLSACELVKLIDVYIRQQYNTRVTADKCAKKTTKKKKKNKKL